MTVHIDVGFYDTESFRWCDGCGYKAGYNKWNSDDRHGLEVNDIRSWCFCPQCGVRAYRLKKPSLWRRLFFVE